MQDKYNNEVVPALRKTFDLKNIMEVPRITKVVVNIGMGEALDNPKALESETAKCGNPGTDRVHRGSFLW
jgi:large subunit ribosomal protein L5